MIVGVDVLKLLLLGKTNYSYKNMLLCISQKFGKVDDHNFLRSFTRLRNYFSYQFYSNTDVEFSSRTLAN